MNKLICKVLIIIFSISFLLPPCYGVMAVEGENEEAEKTILLLTPNKKTNFDTLLVDSLKQYLYINIPGVEVFEENINDDTKITITKNNEIVEMRKKLDLVICLDGKQLDLLKESGKEILGDIPVLIGISESKPVSLPENFGGYYMPYNFDLFMDYLLEIHPGISSVNLLVDNNFSDSYFYKEIQHYINNHNSDVFTNINFIISGLDKKVVPSLSTKNSINIIYTSLMTKSEAEYPTFSPPIGTIRAISRDTTNATYGGFRNYISRFNIGGYNYDATYLSNTLLNDATAILSNDLDIKDLGYNEIKPDIPFIINTNLMNSYGVSNDLNNTLYTDLSNGATTFEVMNDKSSKTILLIGIVIVIIFLISYTYDRKLLKNRDKVDNMKNNFIANVSHELRTPLNIIIGTIQLFELYLKKGSIEFKEESLYDKMDYLKNNSNRLLRLVNNIIDITKLDAGFFTISKGTYNIISVVENITLSTIPYAEYRDIQLIFDTDIEEVYCSFDKERIERVILNLLSNAIKFTPQGGEVKVSTTYMNNEINIVVQDNGIGIPHEKLGLIFERFRQIDGENTKKNEGSGIGLSLCKSMIELHNGIIKVESELDFGSKFIITLPIVKDNSHNDMTINNPTNINELVKLEYSDFSNFL